MFVVAAAGSLVNPTTTAGSFFILLNTFLDAIQNPLDNAKYTHKVFFFESNDFCFANNMEVPKIISTVDNTLRADKDSPMDLGVTSAVSRSVSIGSRSLIIWTSTAEPYPKDMLVERHPMKWNRPMAKCVRLLDCWRNNCHGDNDDDDFVVESLLFLLLCCCCAKKHRKKIILAIDPVKSCIVVTSNGTRIC